MNVMPAILLGLAILISIGAPACSQRGWYEGAQQSQRNECYQQPPSAREECLKALDREDYDEYQRKRREATKK